MYYTDYEKFLGQPLSIVSGTLGCKFKSIGNPKLKTKLYSSEGYLEKEFYGLSNHNITLILDDKNNIQSITIHFSKTIDSNFYNLFINDYGEPNNILVIQNSKIVSKEIDVDSEDNRKQELVKKEFDLREGTFDENPLYIIWEKENFQIKAFLRHKINISEITFSVKTE